MEPFVLENKWFSILRLQGKILSLEEEVENLKRKIRSGVGKVEGSSDATEDEENPEFEGDKKLLLFPRHTPSSTLTGHKGGVTSLCFHPLIPFVFLFSFLSVYFIFHLSFLIISQKTCF